MQMPAGSYMAEIQGRGKLRVAVDQNTLFFGYRNPRTNELMGFDIDVAKLIARAIFGDDKDRIEYVVVSTPQRQDAIAPPAGEPRVDMVASLMTMRCTRWNDMLFSSQYYDAAQGLLVRRGSDIRGIENLAGRRVCATRGSTSSSRMQQLQPQVEMLEVGNRTECLVALQNGRADAITADDTILYGFKAQDRTTEFREMPRNPEPYGLAINKANEDFVRFVNGVLEQARADGRLQTIADEWSERAGVQFPPIPPPTYRD
jgi:polar amino acid transport system substrate-binding protein